MAIASLIARCRIARYCSWDTGVVRSRTMSLQTTEKFLHEIVSTVSSSLELKEVLRSVVRLMS